jgi:hypothetical protein
LIGGRIAPTPLATVFGFPIRDRTVTPPGKSPLMIRRLEDYRRIVVKIGSALLVDRATGDIHWPWLESLAQDVVALAKDGREILQIGRASCRERVS